MLGFADQDVHKLRHVKGCGNLVRAASREPTSIFRALKRGNFYCFNGVEIMEMGRDGETIRISTKNANTIRFIGRNGTIIEETEGKSGEIQFKDGELYTYIRIECLGQRGDVSWTQPFFRS